MPQVAPLSPELQSALNRPRGSISPAEKHLSREYYSRASKDPSLPFQTKMGLLHHAVLANPYYAPALEMYGWELTQIKAVDFAGFLLLERAFDPDMEEYLNPNTSRSHFLCTLIGRYNHTIHKYETARRFFMKAYESSSNNTDVNAVQLATCITSFPTSVKNAAWHLAQFHQWMDKVLKKEKLLIPPVVTYDLILLSAFNFELYYEADIRACMHKYYLLTVKIFPSLAYAAPRFAPGGGRKVGVASGFFGKNNSVIADFGGMLQRLDRSRFDLVFINIVEKGHADEFPWEAERKIDVLSADDGWLERARAAIEAQQFDLILYLDSTMSSSVQQLMMSKLARVQAVSHGHPVTTGIPRETVNFFVSWAAAELPSAQDHYTEELLLLEGSTMHQYYSHRIDAEGRSVITNEPYRQFERAFFETLYHVPPQRRWYTCMQKPFKLHPEFDEMCLGILAKDPNGVLILHAPDFEENQEVLQRRLGRALDRVHFVPALPHHILMGLYNVSDVVLDSYYAGGCTTTREALEIGAPVVTLPGKYLGGRWSLAYYRIMGYTELVAESKEHYVELALSVGPRHREEILANVHKLFFRDEAVQSWTRALETMLGVAPAADV
jgi:hypothetical protein|eukprot:gene11357-8078_t